jgi:hypothetical protein
MTTRALEKLIGRYVAALVIRSASRHLPLPDRVAATSSTGRTLPVMLSSA